MTNIVYTLFSSSGTYTKHIFVILAVAYLKMDVNVGKPTFQLH